MPATVEADELLGCMTRSRVAAEQRDRFNAAHDHVQPTVKGSLASTGDWSTA